MSKSDLDEESYYELMKESAKTGKSVQQILAERKGLVYTENKNMKMTDEVRKTLAENTFKIRPKKEETDNESK